MIIPDYQSLMLPVLTASSKGEVRIGAVVEELADQLGLNSQERSGLLPSGKQTVFSNRVNWAKAYLSKAGLVEPTRRGHFKITPRGQAVLQSPPSYIDNKFLTQFEEFRQFRERATGSEGEGTNTVLTPTEDQRQTPDETMRTAHRQQFGPPQSCQGLIRDHLDFFTSGDGDGGLLSKRIVLIDGDQLASLMVEHNVGCRIEDTLNIKKIDEEFFEA
jgi:restriction endonuclease Mrr